MGGAVKVTAVAFALLAPGALFGCADDRVFLPEGISAPAYAVAAVDRDATRLQRVVLSEPAALSFDYEAGEQVALYTLGESLEALGLEAGPLTLKRTGRSAPIMQSFLLDGEWTEDSAIPTFDLPDFDPNRCWQVGQCAVTSSTFGIALCENCDIEAPALPEEPTRNCPAGWTGTEDDGFWMCLPAAPVTANQVACPIGQYRSFGLGPCLDVAPCEVDWPAPPPGPLLYFDAAAADGGNGSRSNPYNDLSAQLPLPSGATVLLAAGTYSGGLDLQGQTVQGRGVCTVIESTNEQAALRVITTGMVAKVRLHNIAGGPALVVRPGARAVARFVEVLADNNTAVQINGRFTANHCVFRAGPPQAAILVGPGATLGCSNCELVGQSGVSQAADSQLSLRSSRVTKTGGPLGHGVLTLGGQLVMDSVQIFGFRTGVGSGPPMGPSYPTAVTLSEVHVTSESTGVESTRTVGMVFAADPEQRYPVDLQRIAVRGPDTAFSLQHLNVVRFEDIAIEGTVSAIDLDHAGQPGLIHPRRVWIDTDGPLALIDGDLDSATFTLEQVWLRRRTSNSKCLFDNNQELPNTSLTPKVSLQGAYIDPGEGCTLEDYFFEAEDLTVAHQGHAFLGPGNGRNSVVGHRVRFVDARIGLDLQDSPFDLQDLTIEGAANPNDGTTRAPGGLLCLGAGTGTIQRARIVGKSASIRIVDTQSTPEEVFLQNVLLDGAPSLEGLTSHPTCTGGITPTDLNQRHIRWRGVLARP